MTSRAPTLSGLSLVASCPGSASLPHQRTEGLRRSPLGRAIHEVIERGINGDALDPAGVASFNDLDDDDTGRLTFLAAHLRLPVPPGALAEVPLGYWLPERDAEVTPGSVRRFTPEEMAEAHARGMRYPDAGQDMSGTLDLTWAEAHPLRVYPADGAMPEHVECPPTSTLWVEDTKTGTEDNVPSIERNWQLRAGALLAARWTGASRVIPAICYVNAAECAVAVCEGRPYEGRWEVGAPLDAAPLDAIEVELRAVLRAARGESDASDWNMGGEGAGGNAEPGDSRGTPPRLLRARRDSASPALILGPHCEHCPARAACPALAAEAVSLATGAGIYLPPGGALTTAAASHLAGLIPAARRMLDAAEEAVRAHVRAFGPVRLSDGREYGPHLETVTGYRTQSTFDALAPVVGEERANDAAEYTATSIKRALAEAGAPRGAWKALKATIETAGGVVVTAREVWRRTQAATPVKVVSDENHGDARREGPGSGSGAVADGAGDEGDRQAEREPLRGGPEGGGDHDDQRGSGAGTDGDAHIHGRPMTARAICPTCGAHVLRLKSGALRKHNAPGTSMYCVPVASAQIAMVEA